MTRIRTTPARTTPARTTPARTTPARTTLARATLARATPGLATLGLAGLLGLSGCGAAARTVAGQPSLAADVSDEAYALQAVGLETGLGADPKPAPSASAAPSNRLEHRRAIRRYLRKNTLHGEVVVQGKDGVKTIVVQRGTVTAVTSTGVSVKSTDGFVLTWTFGDQLRVLQDRKTVQAGAVKTGAEIGIAGTKDGSTSSARLIVVK